ncbi:MAG: type II toxin-antitoxin system RatA family toxin [Dermatophilaceae bacterium]
MPTVAAQTDVARSAEQVWASVRSAPALAVQAPHVVHVTAHGDTSHWTVLLNGSEVTWTQRDHAGTDTVLRFEQTGGDFEAMSGQWEVADIVDGCRIRLTIDFDLGVDGLAPLLEPMWAQSLRAHAEALLRVVPIGLEDE